MIQATAGVGGFVLVTLAVVLTLVLLSKNGWLPLIFRARPRRRSTLENIPVPVSSV